MNSLATRLLLLLTVCAFLAPLAHADDSAVFDTGKNVYPINNDNIRMVSETVTIYRTNDPIRGRIANVDCEFVFENVTAEVQEVKVGFPGITCETTDPLCTPGLSKFVSYINGEEVPVDIKEEIIQTYSYYEIDSKGNRVPAEGYTKRNWYTWDVTFPPNSRVKLRNTYETVVSGETDGHFAFVYILKTGANWKGTIGNAKIEVNYDDDFIKRRVIKIEPEGYEISGDKIIWELNDFTPQEDIVIHEISDAFILNMHKRRFVSYFDSKRYEGADRLYTLEDMTNQVPFNEEDFGMSLIYPAISKNILSEDLERFYVRFLRNEIYAHHGKKDLGGWYYPIFNPYGEAVSWYKENANYSDELLNDIEKQNIKFIEDYEKARGWR